MLNRQPEKKQIWQNLAYHKKEIDALRIDKLFEDKNRAKTFVLANGDIRFDFSHTKTNPETIELLTSLAKSYGLHDQIEAIHHGAHLNTTEDRPALHMALRGSTPTSLEIDGKNVTEITDACLVKIKSFVETLHNHKRFTHIVNIGVGGSDIGPRLVAQALKKYQIDGLHTHFLSTIDPAEIHELFSVLEPEKTLFIIASKSFGTQETLHNFEIAKDWISHDAKSSNWQDHFIAVTARREKAEEAGFKPDHIFDMQDWVGGRFSLWSAIGIIIPIAIGFENFKALLHGAQKADAHFVNSPLAENIPVMMALIGIWHSNVFKYQAQCVLPYNYNLRTLARYVQQLDMESNGKSVTRDGTPITGYQTAPAVFGEIGTNAQHAFFQMLHQGTEIIPCEFIVTENPVYDDENAAQHTLLLSNVYGQMKALMVGDQNSELPHKNFPGDRPSTLVTIKDLTPENLGMLLAFYEHKTFVQGVIWGVNSFDQWGVELGKKLALEALENL